MARIITAHLDARRLPPDATVVVFTEAELQTLTNALSVAAERFNDNARVCDDAKQPRIAEQFRKQVAETRALYLAVIEAA